MTKKRLYGIDTKQSAARVEKQVMQVVRKPKKNRGFVVMPAIVVSAMVLFLAFQLIPTLQNSLNYQVPMTTLDDELVIEISSVTEEDIFDNNERVTPEQEFKEDYKVLLYRYQGKKLSGEKVTIALSTNWRQFLNDNFGEHVYAWGNGWSQMNDSEDFIHDEFRVVFNAKNITEAELQAALSNVYLEITYEKLQGVVEEEKVYLDKFLQYKE